MMPIQEQSICHVALGGERVSRLERKLKSRGNGLSRCAQGAALRLGGRNVIDVAAMLPFNATPALDLPNESVIPRCARWTAGYRDQVWGSKCRKCQTDDVSFDTSLPGSVAVRLCHSGALTAELCLETAAQCGAAATSARFDGSHGYSQ